jgi:hypothetical protein
VNRRTVRCASAERYNRGPPGWLGWTTEDKLLQEGLGQPRIPTGRNPDTALPAAKRAGIDVDQPGECRLRQPPFPPVGKQPLADCAIRGPGYVSQKPHDRRKEPERGFRSVEFPVRDRSRICPEPLGDLALEQPQIEPALPKMISNGDKDLRVGPGQGSRPGEP